jgi:hypothetical protein
LEHYDLLIADYCFDTVLWRPCVSVRNSPFVAVWAPKIKECIMNGIDVLDLIVVFT